MNDEIIRPKINLKEQKTIKCEKCESKYFKEVTMLKTQLCHFLHICVMSVVM